MYIKVNNGPIEVKLPNGEKLNRSDLPPKTTTRWVASRKLLVVQAVVFKLLEFQEACQMYGLSDEELGSWINHAQKHGPNALKVTSLLKFRQP